MSYQERHLDQQEMTRGQQAAVGALIRQEHYPRIRRLQTTIGYENYQKIQATRTGKRKTIRR